MWWQWVVASALLVVVGWLGWLGLSLKNAEDKMYRPIPARPTAVVGQHQPASAGQATPQSSPTKAVVWVAMAGTTPTPIAATTLILPTSTDLNGTARFNVLLMGIDQRPEIEASRSDTIILVSIDPVSKTVAFLSIPRDMAVDIPGYGLNKVNASYLFGEYYKQPGGGAGLTIATIEKLFGVPIKYYISVNFQGFQKVVDAVGGVDIEVPYSIDDNEYPTSNNGTMTVHFDAGLQHMDGVRALEYVRTRHADGDFARQARQRQVILALRARALQLNVLPNLPNLISSVGDTVQTNLDLGEQISLARLMSGIDSSHVISTAISPQMILPYTDPSLGDTFKLDWNAAQSELGRLFGGDYGYTEVAADKPKPSTTQP